MRCTIYSPVVDHQVVHAMQALLPEWSLQLEGEPTRWSSARFIHAQGLLVFNSLERTAPMDEFSKIILGTCNYFWRREDIPEPERKELMRFAGGARWLIGVVATSKSLPEDFFRHMALEVARRLGGRVFLDGRDLVAPEPVV